MAKEFAVIIHHDANFAWLERLRTPLEISPRHESGLAA